MVADMNNSHASRRKWRHITYALAAAAYILEAITMAIYTIFDAFIFPLHYLASVVILACAILIRFFVIDTEAVERVIVNTDIPELLENGQKPLKPSRFYNFMLVAMVFNAIAGLVLHYSLRAGVMVFLVAHICHLTAFSGILHFNMQSVFARHIRRVSIPVTILWVAVTSLIYASLVIASANGPLPADERMGMALGLLPYVVILGFTTLTSYLGHGYRNRPARFRWMMALGMTCFIFSDSFIGYTIFVGTPKWTVYVIQPVYLTAIFLLQFAVLAVGNDD